MRATAASSQPTAAPERLPRQSSLRATGWLLCRRLTRALHLGAAQGALRSRVHPWERCHRVPQGSGLPASHRRGAGPLPEGGWREEASRPRRPAGSRSPPSPQLYRPRSTPLLGGRQPWKDGWPPWKLRPDHKRIIRLCRMRGLSFWGLPGLPLRPPAQPCSRQRLLPEAPRFSERRQHQRAGPPYGHPCSRLHRRRSWARDPSARRPRRR